MDRCKFSGKEREKFGIRKKALNFKEALRLQDLFFEGRTDPDDFQEEP